MIKGIKEMKRITKTKPFINKYNWQGVTSSSEKNDWNKFEKNNVIIALNVLYAKKEIIYPAYVSNRNWNREKQIILMITNGEGWQYLAVKKLSALLRKITSRHHSDFYCLNCLHSVATENKHGFHKKTLWWWHYLAVEKSALLKGISSKNNGDFYCLICLHSFVTKNKLESHKKENENNDLCNVLMPSEDNKILKFNPYQKSDKTIIW